MTREYCEAPQCVEHPVKARCGRDGRRHRHGGVHTVNDGDYTAELCTKHAGLAFAEWRARFDDTPAETHNGVNEYDRARIDANNAEPEPERTDTVSIMPRWVELMPLLCDILENGDDDAREIVREELAKLAQAVDELNETSS